MIDRFLDSPDAFISKERGKVVPVTLLEAKSALAIKDAFVKNRMQETGFKALPGTFLMVHDNEGVLRQVLAGISSPLRLYDLSPVADALGKSLSRESLANLSFRLDAPGLKPDALERACAGWGLACHHYNFYKLDQTPPVLPQLIWPKGVNIARVKAILDGICLIRNLVNTPANDMGPDELEQSARLVAKRHKATVAIVKGEALAKDFPLIHAVGVSSPRTPLLIDMKWGKTSDPKVTIVGKGVCFDTGGLNLKPGQYMLQMKKDMGGSAHALGVAQAIMTLGLPVRLRVLIPAVENSVSGTSFRPRDVYRSRKGLSVETSDTDAEGRLVLADALTLACEERPDILFDFSTLTGSARAGLGYDIPAVFSNSEMLADELKATAMKVDDPLWPLPLWQAYKKELASDIADLNNIGTSPAGAITAALFLEHFVEPGIPWIHLDMYAWEQTGRPGRPRGGADTGMRAVLAFLEHRYKKK